MMDVVFETKGKQQQMDVHFVHAPASCVVEENYLALAEVLQDQESVYQSFQREDEVVKASPSSDSRPNPNSGQHGVEGNSSRSSSVESQLAIDEALARKLQEMEDQLAGASLSGISGTEAGTSSSSATTVGQHTSNTSDQLETQVLNQDDVDPDSMSYEELQSLGEVIGTESKGLPDELIAYLPSSTYKTGFFSRKEKQECVICYMAYKNRDKLITLPCQHHYHSHCVTRWLKINKACPVCNEEVFGS